MGRCDASAALLAQLPRRACRPPSTYYGDQQDRAWHARAEDDSHGPAGGGEEGKPLPFSVTLVAAAAFTLMLSPKKSMRRTDGGKEERGNWQRELRPKRAEEGEEN